MKRRIFLFFTIILLSAFALAMGKISAETQATAQQYSSDIQIVDSDGDVGQYPSIILDNNDHPHISYYDVTNGDLKYAHWTGSAWNIQTVSISGDIGQYSSIALDNNDSPHISSYDETNNALNYAYWTGTNWITQTVDSGASQQVGILTSLELDNNNDPHISYTDTSELYLKYAYWNGSSWIIQVVPGANPNNGSLKLDQNNFPHIASSWSTYDPFSSNGCYGFADYSFWTGSNWSRIDGDQGEFFVSNVSLVLDSSDVPNIAYIKHCPNDNTSALIYAEWTGSSWSKQTIENSIGYSDVSLDLDENDNPHISYVDTTNGYLKYAYWTGSSWNIQNIDNSGNVGIFTSLKLENNENAHFSYYDATNDNLLYAFSPASTPTATPTTTPTPTSTNTPTPTPTVTPPAPGPIFLPVVIRPIPCFPGPSEQEPNSSAAEANGPLCAPGTFTGLPDDAKDFFFFTTDSAGLIMLDLLNHIGEDVQVQLYYQTVSGLPVASDVVPPYHIEYIGQPGMYYIFIYTVTFGSTPYQLIVSFP